MVKKRETDISVTPGTPSSAKPWKGLGPGVYELVDDHRGDTIAPFTR